MNFASAGEYGGNVALVEDGNVLVGWPGAPGWTTTGVCCADTDSDKKQTRVPAVRKKHFIGVESLSKVGSHYHKLALEARELSHCFSLLLK